MRRLLFLAAAPVALVVAGACAESNDQGAPPQDDGGGVVPEAGDARADAAVEAAADAGPETCSRTGWCLTPLPNKDLTFTDVWPLEGRAFAIATSPTVGVKILEWVEANGQWSYIDDGTQNEGGLGQYVGRLWAPNENEIYYGVSPGIIYHGVRPASPQTEWSWTRSTLPDLSRIPGRANAGLLKDPSWGDVTEYALGVWGTGANDVYAWYLNAIFHWTGEDGGPPSWVLEHAARDVPETNQDLYFISASGTSASDVWFSGARPGSYRMCAAAVNKVAGEYKRAADGILTPSATDWSATCVPPAGIPSLGTPTGWATDIQSPAPGIAFTLKGIKELARVTRTGDSYTATVMPVPGLQAMDRVLSVWAPAENEQWISGRGIIFRASDAWNGGKFEISTLEMRGAPIRGDLKRIRGTSNTNLWAIGVGYALHKTRP